MIIGVNAYEANIKNRVGVNVYAFELLCSIYRLTDLWKDQHKFVIYLQSEPLDDFPAETSWWKYRVLPAKSLWVITKLMPTLFFEKKKPDLVFNLGHYISPFAPQPQVCSIMDLGYLESSGHFRKSDYWQLRLWSAWSIMVSKKVFTISESSKEDIIRHYPNVADKIVVTYLGYDPAKFNESVKRRDSERVRGKYGIKGDYLLFLSTLKPNKNVSSLVKAFKRLSSRFKALKLVIAGKKGWLYADIFSEVKAQSLEDRVIFTDYLPEADKPGLIAGAKVFVLPSLWEGFGIDALNAMASGVPVVVSNVASLPEVVGDAGILIDPYKVESIADGIEKVLSLDKRQYNVLAEKGLAQAKKFSWEKTARETLKGLGVI